MKEYAAYKGDQLLGIGTAEELAKLLNVKVATIQWYATPVNHKRSKESKNRTVAIRL